jgi:chemotaxis protein CheD
MNKPAGVIEMSLLPGEFYFGDASVRLHTLLGSCVAITMWHPQRRLGGMCHYMLPSRQQPGQHGLDGKYADEAVLLLLREAIRYHTCPQDYQIKLFGGGSMFPGYSQQTNIAHSNVKAARMLLARHQLHSSAEDVGRNGHRNVIFDISSGHVWVRHQELIES